MRGSVTRGPRAREEYRGRTTDDQRPSDPPPPERPLRADARLNHQKLLAAAREAFAEHGATASLEDVARRAEVGIATLYRNFPTRRDLLEAVYLEEFEALSRSADELAGRPPWDALAAWLHRFAAYAATHRALTEELIASLEEDDGAFRRSRETIAAAGSRLLRRAQEAGAARADMDFVAVERMVGGIATIRGAAPGQIAQILDVALDGLRTHPAGGAPGGGVVPPGTVP